MNSSEQLRIVFWALAGAVLGGLVAFIRVADVNATLGGGMLDHSGAVRSFWIGTGLHALIGGAIGIALGALVVLAGKKSK